MRSALIAATIALIAAGCSTTDCHCGKDEPRLKMNLPVGFSCKLEGSDHVCTESDKVDPITKRVDRIVIWTMKERGPEDTLEAYQARFPGSKIVELNGQKWVDATRIAGQIPGYTTRYLATVASEIGVAVTFTAENALWPKFNEDIAPAIAGLVLRH